MDRFDASPLHSPLERRRLLSLKDGCTSDFRRVDNICVEKDGTGVSYPYDCPEGYILVDNQCEPDCPIGDMWVSGRCIEVRLS